MMNSTSQDHELDFQIFDYLRVYKTGRVERLCGTETVPSGEDSITGVSSKDIIQNSISARMYFPDKPPPAPEKLPVLVYFHGGGFCIQTAYSPIYHSFLNSLSSEAKIIIVSVDYRLAPEFPLPAAYDDCWRALLWVVSQLNGGGAAGPEPWLVNFGDLNRLFLAGDSAGANIAHHMALRAGAEGSEGVKIKGIVLMHPYFWGSKMEGEEEKVGDELRKRLDELWMFVCPASNGVDDPMINPLAENAPDLALMACDKIMVCVANKDLLSVRARAYYERLKEKWAGLVELVVSHGMDHVFHLDQPGCDQAVELRNKVVAFLRS